MENIFTIKRHLCTLGTTNTGWTRELNIVDWNGMVRYDIRDWSPDHQHMGRGLRLTKEEAAHLASSLKIATFDHALERVMLEDAVQGFYAREGDTKTQPERNRDGDVLWPITWMSYTYDGGEGYDLEMVLVVRDTDNPVGLDCEFVVKQDGKKVAKYECYEDEAISVLEHATDDSMVKFMEEIFGRGDE